MSMDCRTKTNFVSKPRILEQSDLTAKRPPLAVRSVLSEIITIKDSDKDNHRSLSSSKYLYEGLIWRGYRKYLTLIIFLGENCRHISRIAAALHKPTLRGIPLHTRHL